MHDRAEPRDEPIATPELGLVCVTTTAEVRYRTVTRTRYLALDKPGRVAKLEDLYRDNVERLDRALTFCAANGIRLYRITSSLFPMSDLDDGIGVRVLEGLAARIAAVGARSRELGIRMLMHPDQYVVLSSDSSQVVANSVVVMGRHAMTLDLLGLPRSAWAPLILHGGKGGRHEALVREVLRLPDGARERLVLENDERAYGAAEILAVCREAGVPMVFDAHHHAVREKLGSYDDPSVLELVAAARETWPDPAWQVVHLSNGKDRITDPRHTDFIESVPRAFRLAPWIEVEAKAKERAIERLRREWSALAGAAGS